MMLWQGQKNERDPPHHGVQKRAHGVLDLQGREHADSSSLVVLVEAHVVHVFEGSGVVLRLQAQLMRCACVLCTCKTCVGFFCKEA
jgi:hypothetical protein